MEERDTRLLSSIERVPCHSSSRAPPRALGFEEYSQGGMARTAVFVQSVLGTRLSLTNKGYHCRGMHVPTINATRLNDSIHSTSVWGAAHRWGPLATETGMARLALSDDDASVRRWFVAQTKALGCTVTVDMMGNTFAVRPGARDGPPTAIGSHLDTQPSGGRYDGVLGVMAGLEALRTIVQEGITTNYPVAVINWTKSAFALWTCRAFTNCFAHMQ